MRKAVQMHRQDPGEEKPPVQFTVRSCETFKAARKYATFTGGNEGRGRTENGFEGHRFFYLP